MECVSSGRRRSRIMASDNSTLTRVAGLRVGHHTDVAAATGCTVVLCETGATAAVEIRGAAPASRECELLGPGNIVQQVHGVLLTGGSAFGLSAADGVVRYLEELGSGFPTSAGPVPIVPAAALFDLAVGKPSVRPGPENAYAACQASDRGPVQEGSVGAGTGATVGHLYGLDGCIKGGLGSAGRILTGGATVGALVAVNAFGDVVDPASGRIVAGARDRTNGFANTSVRIEELLGRRSAGHFGQHTTLALVATDAPLSRDALLRVARMAHDGLARTVRPAHTGFDGDIVFALSTAALEDGSLPSGSPLTDVIVGTVAADLVAESVLRAVTRATSVAGVPAVSG
jgi:L-aminopeptidase/D-esterase-like protein